jgi:hypothetical protein
MVLLDARGGQYLKTPLLYINEGKEWVDLNAYIQLYALAFRIRASC